MTAASRGELRQEQQLRLQQRISQHNVALGRLLAMSAPQFDDEVQRQLDDNPALEAIDDRSAAHDSATGTEDGFGESAEQLMLADYASDDDIPHYRLEARNHSADDAVYDAGATMADDSASGFDILRRRLAETDLSPLLLKAATYIAGNLDSNGYLTRPLPDIADDIAVAEGIFFPPHEMEHAFEAVRSLDPAGIGATDLRDCLLLQLHRKPSGPVTDLATEIVAKHFDSFSKKHYTELESATGASHEELEKAIEMVLSLNPRPGAALGGGNTGARTVMPDFVLDYDHAHDTFTVLLAGPSRHLGLEESFTVDPEGVESPSLAGAREFVRHKRAEATAFIRLAELRALTLRTVVEAIVRIQHRFFATGDPSTIVPMVLKDVAAATGLDIPVISRATAGKYILTTYGIYPLKYFFNEHPRTDDAASGRQIMEALSDMLRNEDSSNPLSDRALTEQLVAQGYDVARRTVAKYRERLGYPVARLRKTFRKNVD